MKILYANKIFLNSFDFIFRNENYEKETRFMYVIRIRIFVLQ